MATQLQDAQAGTLTEQIKSVAEGENLEAELVRAEVTAGHLVIPANKLHLKSNLIPQAVYAAL
jgi:thiamine biosynthesis protein ThiC